MIKRKVEIYQLSGENFKKALENRFNKNYKIDFNKYEKVYEYDIESPILNKLQYEIIADRVFEDCNVGLIRQDENYKGHSLSVTDIVKIDDVVFMCESLGWVKIDNINL